MTQIKIVKRYGNKGVMLHETEHLQPEARLAVEMAVRWGMVAGEPDGEDSAGRQKLKLLSPEALAQRAFDAARCLMEQANARGLVLQGPDISELIDPSDA